jgi:hypothetical protein
MRPTGLDLQKKINILSHVLKNFKFRGCEILMWQRLCKRHGSYYGRIKWLQEITLQIFYVPHLFKWRVRFSIHWRTPEDFWLLPRNGAVIDRWIFLTFELFGAGFSYTLTKAPVCFPRRLGFSHTLAPLIWVSSYQWVSPSVVGIAEHNGETDWLGH